MGYVWCLVELKRDQLGINPGDMPYAVLPTRPDMKALEEKAVQVRDEFMQFWKEKDWVKKVQSCLTHIRAVEEHLWAVEAESSLTAQHWEARALAMERLVQERASRLF
jgi:hypothetical protein